MLSLAIMRIDSPAGLHNGVSGGSDVGFAMCEIEWRNARGDGAKSASPAWQVVTTWHWC